MKNKKTTSAPVNPEKTEQVLILPGCLFFVEVIDVPNELEVSEIPDFAELSLESIAPFPIEQLFWGYIYHKDMPTLLLYAAHSERIKKERFSDLDDYAWVVPDFAVLSNARFNDDTLVLLEGRESIGMVYFESNTTIPKAVWTDIITEPISSDEIQSLRLDIPDLPKTASVLHLRPTVVTMNENGLPTFENATAEQTEGRPYDGTWQSLSPSESQLWQMDVRSTGFKTVEKNKRRMSQWIARITGWAAVFALILTGAEGVLFASRSWLETQLTQIERQRETVLKVEEKQTLVNKLDQVAKNELRPIEMLEVANDIRLQLNLGIEYDSVVIEGENHITIEGKAKSISALNRYVDNLKNSGLFELLDEQKPITRNGKTTFKVSLAYTPKMIPFAENPAENEENAVINISAPNEEVSNR